MTQYRLASSSVVLDTLQYSTEQAKPRDVQGIWLMQIVLIISPTYRSR